jgi:hypothetical protein
MGTNGKNFDVFFLKMGKQLQKIVGVEITYYMKKYSREGKLGNNKEVKANI